MKTKLLNFFGGWFGLCVCIFSWIMICAAYVVAAINCYMALVLVFITWAMSYSDHCKQLRYNELKQLCHTEEDFQKLREENEKLRGNKQ